MVKCKYLESGGMCNNNRISQVVCSEHYNPEFECKYKIPTTWENLKQKKPNLDNKYRITKEGLQNILENKNK